MNLIVKPARLLAALLMLLAGCAAPAAQPQTSPATPSAARPAQTATADAGPAAADATATPGSGTAADPPAGAGVIAPETAEQLTAAAQPLPEPVEYLLWSHPGRLLALTAQSVVYPVTARQPALEEKYALKMPANGGPIAFAADGSLAAVMNQNGQVGLFAPQPDGALIPVGSLNALASSASFSADGQRVLLTDPQKARLTLYEAHSGAPLKQFEGFQSGDPVYTALLSPDGKTILWRSRGEAQLQDALTGQMGPKLEIRQMIGALVFSPDSRLIAAALGDHLAVFNAADGKPLTELRLSAAARSLAFSPDGRLLAAGFGPNLQLWDTATWRPLAPLPAHNAPIARVAFSPDGTVLASVDDGQELRLWSLPAK